MKPVPFKNVDKQIQTKFAICLSEDVRLSTGVVSLPHAYVTKLRWIISLMNSMDRKPTIHMLQNE